MWEKTVGVNRETGDPKNDQRRCLKERDEQWKVLEEQKKFPEKIKKDDWSKERKNELKWKSTKKFKNAEKLVQRLFLKGSRKFLEESKKQRLVEKINR